MTITRDCAYCGTEFETENPRREYCADNCRKLRSRKNREGADEMFEGLDTDARDIFRRFGEIASSASVQLILLHYDQMDTATQLRANRTINCLESGESFDTYAARRNEEREIRRLAA